MTRRVARTSSALAGAATGPDPLLALPPALRPLAERGERRRYRKHTLLIQEGDQGDTIYIVLSGRLRAFSANEQGREITYGIYGPGEYLGEMSLDGGPRSASVETLDTCECVVVTRRTLAAHLAEDPEFAFELLAKVIRRARAATLSARQMALEDVYGRLKALLEQVAEPADPSGERIIAQRLTHLGLSQQLGCSREMISRLLKGLEQGGYVAFEAPPGRWRLLRALPPRW